MNGSDYQKMKDYCYY